MLFSTNVKPSYLGKLWDLTLAPFDVTLFERLKYHNWYLNASVTRWDGKMNRALLECPKGWVFTGHDRYQCVLLKKLKQGSEAPFSITMHRIMQPGAPLLKYSLMVERFCTPGRNGVDSCGSKTESSKANLGTQCTELQFKCKDGHCISDKLMYDRHPDCPDGSDEIHQEDMCSTEHIDGKTPAYRCDNCSPPHCVCGPHYYQCHTQGCIHWDSVCDDINDCKDFSDETMCVMNWHMTLHDTSTPKCNSDTCEWNSSSLVPHIDWSDETMLQCENGHPDCFPISALCVYDLDKLGHQRFCPNGAHLHKCIRHHCPDKFKCPNSYCIPVRRLCDGRKDCPEGEDEDECEQIPLLCPGFYRCQGGMCIHPHEICDGYVDCELHGDDEKSCYMDPCPNGCQCHRGSMICHREEIPKTLSMQLKLKVTGLVNFYADGLTHFNGSSILLSLDLSGNNIKYVKGFTFSELRNLLILNLSSSDITYLEEMSFEGLNELIELNLQKNLMTTFDVLTFKSLTNLKFLDLSHQKLRKLPKDVFGTLQHLRRIDLSNNDLKTIVLLTQMINVTIDISMNPLTHVETPYTMESWSLIASDNYLCCLETYSCEVPKRILHLCPNELNNALTVIYILYAMWLIMANLSLAIIIKMRTSRSASRIVVVCSCLVDMGQGVHIMWLSVKDIVWDTATVHQFGGLKHKLCVVMAWLQMSSSTISITLKTVHAWMFYRQASTNVLGLNLNLKHKLVFLITGIYILSASPILYNNLLMGTLLDVSSHCSLLLIQVDQPIWWLVIVITCFLLCHMVMSLLIIWFAVNSLSIIKDSAARLAEFGLTSRISRAGPRRLWVRAYVSLCVEFVSLVILINASIKHSTNIHISLDGSWINIIYSLPAFVQTCLQINSLYTIHAN